MSMRAALPSGLLAAGLLAGGLWATGVAHAARDEASRSAGGVPSTGAVGVLAADLLMLRAEALYEEGRWAEMQASFELLGRLQPTLASAWEYRGWHLAYNLAGGARDDEARARWVLAGVRVLEEGIHRNPTSTSLRFYLGHVLISRSHRWPEVRRRLAGDLGEDPVDRGVSELRRAHADDPLDGRTVVRLTDALGMRGVERLRRAPSGERAPLAEEDFAEAVDLLRALAAASPGDVPAEARATMETLARGFENLRDAARTTNAEARRTVLRLLE